ncbi:MAG: hypothetical protein OXF93_03490 [Acidobacteria bacterium]|nr:hypothetical protein [Acidobacteriota bacterium]
MRRIIWRRVAARGGARRAEHGSGPGAVTIILHDAAGGFMIDNA